MQIFLETERLRLRQFTPDDVDNLLALDSNVEVRRYLDMPTPPTRESITEHILPRFIAYYALCAV
jgi:RimJ/RimL family protein N-acetyltransferase